MANVHRREELKPTRCILGLVDGDGGAGEGRAAGVLQGDVDAVGAGLLEPSPQTHFAHGRRRDVVAGDGAHLGAAGVRHDGAGGEGDAGEEEREGGELKMAADVLPVGGWKVCDVFLLICLFKYGHISA